MGPTTCQSLRACRASLAARLAVPAAAWIAACGGAPSTGPAAPPRDLTTTWSYETDRGRFVQSHSDRALTPKDLLAAGQAMNQDGDADGAINAFRAIHGSPVDATLKAEALREEARTLARVDRRGEAHAAFLEFFDRYTRSPLLPDTLREAFGNAFAYADQSSTAGVQAVRDLLNRYPREDFSAEQAFHLAEFFYRGEEFAVASGEFDTVRREYPRTPWAEAALYRIGLCEFRQFKGIDYDPKPLEAARRQLEKFLLDYPSSSLSDEAKKTLSEVKSILARKALAVADYYSARGRETGARFMYAAVATDYPETEAGRTAAETLKTLPEPEPDPQ